MSKCFCCQLYLSFSFLLIGSLFFFYIFVKQQLKQHSATLLRAASSDLCSTPSLTLQPTTRKQSVTSTSTPALGVFNIVPVNKRCLCSGDINMHICFVLWCLEVSGYIFISGFLHAFPLRPFQNVIRFFSPSISRVILKVLTCFHIQ